MFLNVDLRTPSRFSAVLLKIRSRPNSHQGMQVIARSRRINFLSGPNRSNRQLLSANLRHMLIESCIRFHAFLQRSPSFSPYSVLFLDLLLNENLALLLKDLLDSLLLLLENFGLVNNLG